MLCEVGLFFVCIFLVGGGMRGRGRGGYAWSMQEKMSFVYMSQSHTP